MLPQKINIKTKDKTKVLLPCQCPLVQPIAPFLFPPQSINTSIIILREDCCSTPNWLTQDLVEAWRIWPLLITILVKCWWILWGWGSFFADLIDFVVHLPFLMQFFWVTLSGYPPNPKKKVLVSNSEGLLEPLSPYHIMCTKSDLPCMEHNPLLNLPPPPCDQGLAGRCRSYWPECNFPLPPSSSPSYWIRNDWSWCLR